MPSSSSSSSSPRKRQLSLPLSFLRPPSVCPPLPALPRRGRCGVPSSLRRRPCPAAARDEHHGLQREEAGGRRGHLPQPGRAGADSFKDDGVYSRYFTAYSENGTYNLKVRVHGGANSARRSSRHALNRAVYIPGWVVDGEIQGNPSRPEVTEGTQTVLENFSRTASGGAFEVSQVPPLPLPDKYPPSQITDLQATLNGAEINLTWTAPGDDYDLGKAQQYIIRISENLTDLRDNFDGALQVNTTDLLPNDANSKETFTFKPENISEENATYIFIAIKSVDKSNLESNLSNIAQVALFIPQADASPDENPNPDGSHNSGVNVSTVVLSVVLSVIAVCIIVSATICILKRRSSRRHATAF